MIERLWVEINSRINYPVKQVLVEMDNNGDINMADSLHRYCVLWIAIEVLKKGAETFICSWNSHTIPGKTMIAWTIIILNFVLHVFCVCMTL